MPRLPPQHRNKLDPVIAYTRRLLSDARSRTLGFAYLFAVYSFVQPFAFRRAYPTHSERLAFAVGFGGNRGLRLFYGEPFDLVSTGGYTAWRVGGTLAIAAAAFGVLAAVRALRAEEEAGRAETVLAGLIGRRSAFLAVAVAIGLEATALWLAEFLGLVAGGLGIADSAFLALATVSVIPVFAGFGAVASEVVPTRRQALQIGLATVSLFLLLRAVADTIAGGSWLRWSGPLGWAESLRPFTGPRPLFILLSIAATLVLFGLAGLARETRDIGRGLIASRDTSEGRFGLLRSPFAHSVRMERGVVAVWVASIALFAFILGIVAESISGAGIPERLQKEIERLGGGSIVTPIGYVSFVLFFFVLAVSLFACAQVVAMRREESDQHLETLLSEPVGRSRWLGGRLVIAALGIALLSGIAGMFTWLGAFAAGINLPFGRVFEAGMNGVPTALLFLGVAVLIYGIAPRTTVGLSYGIVLVTFLWQTVGSILGAPRWTVDLTPFGWVALVPTQAFRGGPAFIMLAIGLGAALSGMGWFRRRDLFGA